MAIDNVKEYIEAKVAEIEKLSRRVEKINDVLFAGQEEKEVKGKTKTIPLTAERVKELNRKIDDTITAIENIQANIEIELVNRSLEKDDKAKEFVDNKKADLKDKIQNGKKEAEEYGQVGDKLDENKKLEKINALIKERQDTYNQFKELDNQKQELNNKIKAHEKEIQELQALEKENRKIDDEINSINEKLKDSKLSAEEKSKLEEDLKKKEATKNENKGKLANKSIVLKEKNRNISLLKQQIRGLDINKKEKKDRLSEINKELKGLGITDFDVVHLQEEWNNNQEKINENNKVIDNVKKNLKIEPEKENDVEFIKEKAKEAVDKKMGQIKKLEDKESKLDEASFKEEIKNNIMKQYGEKGVDNLENVIAAVVEERKNKAREERKTLTERRKEGQQQENEEQGQEKGETTGVAKTKSGIPMVTSLVPAKADPNAKIGFWQNIKEKYFSKRFRDERKVLARQMYPELNDIELQNYIDEHKESLNYLIRNNTKEEDVEKAHNIQDEMRKERLDKIKNNSFLEKIKVDLKDGKDVDKTIDDYAQEKAKQALDVEHDEM